MKPFKQHMLYGAQWVHSIESELRFFEEHECVSYVTRFFIAGCLHTSTRVSFRKNQNIVLMRLTVSSPPSPDRQLRKRRSWSLRFPLFCDAPTKVRWNIQKGTIHMMILDVSVVYNYVGFSFDSQRGAPEEPISRLSSPRFGVNNVVL